MVDNQSLSGASGVSHLGAHRSHHIFIGNDKVYRRYGDGDDQTDVESDMAEEENTDLEQQSDDEAVEEAVEEIEEIEETAEEEIEEEENAEDTADIQEDKE